MIKFDAGNFLINKEKQIIFADLALLLIAFIWGIAFVAMKEALKVFPPFYLIALRFVPSFFIIMFIFRYRMKKITLSDVKSGFVIGIFLFLGFINQTIGLKLSSAGKISFLTSVYVVIIPILSWIIYKKFPGIIVFISSAICLTGLSFLTLQNGFNIERGDMFGLICALFYAGQIMAVEYYSKKRDPILITLLQVGTVALFSTVAALCTETWPVKITFSAFLSLMYTILFSTIIALLIQNIAQKYTPASHASIIISFVSVFGALAGFVILGEVFTGGMIFGAMLILISVIVLQIPPGRGEKEINPGI